MQKQDKYSHIVNEMFFLQVIDQEGKPDIKVKVASLLYDVEVKSVKCRHIKDLQLPVLFKWT